MNLKRKLFMYPVIVIFFPIIFIHYLSIALVTIPMWIWDNIEYNEYASFKSIFNQLRGL